MATGGAELGQFGSIRICLLDHFQPGEFEAGLDAVGTPLRVVPVGDSSHQEYLQNSFDRPVRNTQVRGTALVS